MAVFESISIPAQVPATVISGLASGSSTVEQALGKNTIFLINANEDITIRFGAPGFTTSAGVTDFRIPAGETQKWDVGNRYTSFRCYNLGGSPATVYIQFISKF